MSQNSRVPPVKIVERDQGLGTTKGLFIRSDSDTSTVLA
jgi:hypothetical protein